MIAAIDSGYVAPDTLLAGLNHIVFENRGTTIHECMFIRLPETMSPAQYVEAVVGGADFPKGAIDCSGPGLTSPGERVEMWVELEPGEYLLGCWINTHVTKISPTTVTVVSSSAPLVDPPQEDVTVRLVDFRFEMDGEIEPGVRTLRFELVGPSMHEVDIFRLQGGRSRKDFLAWYDSDRQKPPLATAMSGVLDSHEIGRVVWLRRNFTMGNYVMICRMPMIQDGSAADSAATEVTHDQAGMIHEFTVE